MKLHLWGTDFRRSSPEIRQRLFFSPEAREQSLRELLKLGFEDLVYVSTCNRVEFYTTGKDFFSDSRPLWMKLLKSVDLTEEDFYRGFHLEGKSALRHLLRVASSLESMVVGEPQILGQLRESVRWTKEVGLPLSPSLERTFKMAFETAREIRSNTSLGEKPVSVATLGLQTVQKYEPRFPLKQAVVVGRSDISRIVIQWLKKNRPACPILWVNRTAAALESLPESQGVKIQSLWDFLVQPTDFSHLFTATSSLEPVFQSGFFTRLRGDTKLVFDFAQPPDVEKNEDTLQYAQIVQLDDLLDRAKENAAERANAILEAEAILDRSIRDHCLKQKQTPLIRSFSKVEPQIQFELDSAISRLEPELQPRLRKWAEKLVKKNLHSSREHLRTLLKRVTETEEQSSIG